MAGHCEMTWTAPGLGTRTDPPVEADGLRDDRLCRSDIALPVHVRSGTAGPRPTLRCPHESTKAESQGRIRSGSLSRLPPWNSLSHQLLGKKSIQLPDGDRSLCLKDLVYGELPIGSDEMTDLEDTLLIEQTLHGCFGG